ncbi:hypothetical protein E2562_026840 [Oryza meyeriana var. granulata]|uniref:Uncharacterized protein n=1 Tax=Oryza meyeriana var. granulata TaxID=110450 RepID=A0A6G1CKG2_9ORYZ|nr:hypothetical protein E2562_026840 [Oryza meyeriana var. granulata]
MDRRAKRSHGGLMDRWSKDCSAMLQSSGCSNALACNRRWEKMAQGRGVATSSGPARQSNDVGGIRGYG